jgi:primary-amine oxidase
LIYVFHQDGSLELAVRASGYLQASPYYANQSAWRPRIYQATQGSLHDHILTYKADIDTVSEKNSVKVGELKAVKQSQPWFPELGEFSQMELDHSYLEQEKAWDWPANGAAMYCVVNRDEKNTWGEERGYRINPGRSNVHMTVQDSPFSAKNAEFAKHHLAVTVQHDNEPLANSFQNVNLPVKPQQDFAKFFDGESVEQEDLVVWVDLGLHHFSQSEDVPVTLYSEAYSSMVFAPQNFFDRTQDGDLLNRCWITTTPTGELEFEDYGVELPTCGISFEEPVSGILPTVTI